MRLPRMTTRRWIGVIALLAVMLAIEAEKRRRVAGFRRECGKHLRYVQSHYHKLNPLDRLSDAEMERLDPLFGWHDRLFMKYLRAIEHPWLPIEPDPPLPNS